MNKITVVNCHDVYKEVHDKKNFVYCGRGSILGNPFAVKGEQTRAEAIEKFRVWLWNKIKNKQGVEWNEIVRIRELNKEGDVMLGCWCYPKSCHCDVIVKAVEWSRK